MIFKIYLTLIFLFLAIYSYVYFSNFIIRLVCFIGYAGAILLVWNPDLSTNIAAIFGIGRGLDFFLILLSLTLLNGLLIVMTYLNKQHQSITTLARINAIENVIKPPSENKG